MNEEQFQRVVFVWIAAAVVVFPVLLRIRAPYGRHSTQGWGPMIDNRWGWVLMELPALVCVPALTIGFRRLSPDLVWLSTGLWVVHYGYRTLVFPWMTKTRGKKMPVAVMSLAIVFNLINGGLNGYWFGCLASAHEWSTLTYFPGLLLFVGGFLTHVSHDRLLTGLRKSPTDGYQIPRGGLFRLVSCPNFLGEIVEWGGFSLMTGSPAALSFFVWSFVNLTPRALDHHRWYRQAFSEYPPERKALIPWLL